MSDSSRASDQTAAKPSLLERLRIALGMGPASLRDDIEDALEQTDTADDFSPHERAILRNVLGLHEHRVHDIMIPRADIVAVSINATLAETLLVFRDAGHSRLPVQGDTLDDPRGMVHIRDFVDFLTGAAEVDSRGSHPSEEEKKQPTSDPRVGEMAALPAVDLSSPIARANIIRPVLFVPPSMPALDLLVKMQASRTHMALVIDEYGGTEGLVSIEDVVEMIVGDIEDEHDLDEEPRIERLNEREFLVDARAALDAVSENIGVDLVKTSESNDVDTLGGLITSIAGRVPARGEIIRSETPPLEFEIVDADPRRVKHVRIRMIETDSPEIGAADTSSPSTGQPDSPS